MSGKRYTALRNIKGTDGTLYPVGAEVPADACGQYTEQLVNEKTLQEEKEHKSAKSEHKHSKSK